MIWKLEDHWQMQMFDSVIEEASNQYSITYQTKTPALFLGLVSATVSQWNDLNLRPFFFFFSDLQKLSRPWERTSVIENHHQKKNLRKKFSNWRIIPKEKTKREVFFISEIFLGVCFCIIEPRKLKCFSNFLMG